MKITAYKVNDNKLEIVPSSLERDWMDKSPHKFAYRCLPLNIANTAGWEIPLSEDVLLEWDGNNSMESLKVNSNIAVSHFGMGIVTFHIGAILRTEPGWSLWMRGKPNHVYDGIFPLDGIIETAWLPFTATMNFKMTRPGKVKMFKGDPLCFITPVRLSDFGNIDATIKHVSDDSELNRDYENYANSRNEFLEKKDKSPSEWQKFYFRGSDATGTKTKEEHYSKIKFPEFLSDK